MTEIRDTEGRVLFSHDELADRETGEVRLHSGFADELQKLRLAFGRPMVVTSCCRSAERNARIGGHPRSLHVYDAPNHGLAGAAAIDIAAPDGPFKLELIRHAIALGWSVGASKSFVHLDRRDIAGLAPALFTYGGQ